MRRGFVTNEMFLFSVLALSVIAVAVFGFMQARVYSRDNARISDLKQIAHALALYLDAQGSYPSGCEWSTDACWKDLLQDHIRMPLDPINRGGSDCATSPGCFVYRYCRLGEGRFVVSANLEKPKKRPVGNNPSCPLGGPNQHWVTN